MISLPIAYMKCNYQTVRMFKRPDGGSNKAFLVLSATAYYLKPQVEWFFKSISNLGIAQYLFCLARLERLVSVSDKDKVQTVLSSLSYKYCALIISIYHPTQPFLNIPTLQKHDALSLNFHSPIKLLYSICLQPKLYAFNSILQTLSALCINKICCLN